MRPAAALLLLRLLLQSMYTARVPAEVCDVIKNDLNAGDMDCGTPHGQCETSCCFLRASAGAAFSDDNGAGECCHLCATTEGCGCWTFNAAHPKGPRCYLKHAVGWKEDGE